MRTARPWWFACLLLAACGDAPDSTNSSLPNADAPIVATVIGAIHGRHRDSETYPLDRLGTAIIAFEPDYVLTEIPPDRLAEASAQFGHDGIITETRVRVFPELTDTVFPLQQRLGFAIIPVAAWTPAIADDRAAALARIEADPAREAQWSAHLAARRTYSQTVGGRAQDPLFIHSPAYDQAVEAAQAPYLTHFEADLGPGGWGAINEAHFALIAEALDRIAAEREPDDAEPARVLILFGAWHKHWFLRALSERSDVRLIPAAPLFEASP